MTYSRQGHTSDCKHAVRGLTVLLLLVQAVNIGGRSYDVCVKLCGSGRVLLLVENFDDVKAPGLLAQAAQAAAGCPGCLEDEEEGIFWSVFDPLEKKGCYIFFPHETPRGEPWLSLRWHILMRLHPTGSYSLQDLFQLSPMHWAYCNGRWLLQAWWTCNAIAFSAGITDWHAGMQACRLGPTYMFVSAITSFCHMLWNTWLPCKACMQIRSLITLQMHPGLGAAVERLINHLARTIRTLAYSLAKCMACLYC